MVLFNLWLEQVNGQVLCDVVEEYGNVICQLVVVNIFFGDMLFKNFGVICYGWVVFYDYDEICYMMEVNFCEILLLCYLEDELVSELWYSVLSGDVFLEEFCYWLCVDLCIGLLFEEMYVDLLCVDYWCVLQMWIKNGYVEDVYVYWCKQCFSVCYGVDSRLDKVFMLLFGKVC